MGAHALGAATLRAQQVTLHIAAAADLAPVMPPLAARYEHDHPGIHLSVSYGASATLVQQIRNGAPIDLFLSADEGFAQQVVAGGLAAEAAPVPYATGVLVLWTRLSTGLAPMTMRTLTDPRVHRIAIANPEHAPYGRAARATLEHEHLLPALQPKLITAENIGQAAQFVYTGNTDIGLISWTLASTPRFTQAGSYVRVPQGEYPPLVQSAVVLKRSPAQPAAEAFLDWLISPAVQQSLPSLGLAPAPTMRVGLQLR